jgi:hypothetical protein
VSSRSTTGSWKTTLEIAGRQRAAYDVVPAERGAAARRHDRRREHPDRRRLAGPVRAEQPEDLAGLDLEVDALDRLDATGIRLREMSCFHCGRDVHAPVTNGGEGT